MSSPSHDTRERIPESAWAAALELLGLRGATLIWQSRHDRARRVYGNDDKVYKVVLAGAETSAALRRQTMEGEAEILHRCEGIPGIPRILEYRDNGETRVLVLERIRARQLRDIPLDLRGTTSLLVDLAAILGRLSSRGICHRDVTLENVLVDADGTLHLVDFDQAVQSGRLAAALGNFLGIGDKSAAFGSWAGLVKHVILRSLPPGQVSALKKLLGKSDHVLPRIPPDASGALRDIGRAWALAQKSNASSPGVFTAYYGLVFEGVRFPGERDWSSRWSMLRGAVDVRGKRVLELGCNLALLSVFLLKEGGADAALAVDRYEDILAAAALVAGAHGVSPELRRVDLDAAADWETPLLDFGADVVFALSVMNWVQDKHRLLRFLARFPCVVYEGHDHPENEIELMRGAGFGHHRLVGTSERGRAVLVFSSRPLAGDR